MNNKHLKILSHFLSCYSCRSKYKIKKKKNGLVKLSCTTCKKSFYSLNNLVILINNQFNNSIINETLRNQKLIDNLYSSEYVSFVETIQSPPEKYKLNFLNFLKKFLNLSYYIITFWLIFTYFLFFVKKVKHDKDIDNIIDELSTIYAYVPEMAIWKFFEILCIKENFNCSKAGTVLDIGGGNGVIFSLLAKSFEFSLSINSDLYAYENKIYKLNLSEDFSKSTIDDKKIDTIISINSLEHIPNISKIIKNMYRILKNNGKLIFTTPKHNYYECHPIYYFLKKLKLNKISKKYLRWEFENAHHKSINSSEEWIKNLKRGNFKNISIKEIFPSRFYFLVELLNVSAKLHSSWHFWNFTNHILNKFIFLKKINKYALTIIMNRCTNLYGKSSSHLLISAEK